MLFHFLLSILINSSAAYTAQAPDIIVKPWEVPKGQVVTPELQARMDRSALMVAYQNAYSAKGYGETSQNPYGIDFDPLGKRFPIYNNYLRAAVPIAEEFTFSKLMDIIREKNLTTIESVIAEIPSHMKNDNVVYMYRSRSLQAATPTSPRAILYTPTASFVLTFNGGEPGTLGHNTIETVQYRHDERRFEFREISFNGRELPQVSEVNPRKCLECHQSPSRREIDPRPNWEPYSQWVGAFGSNAGRLTGRPIAVEHKHKVLPQDKIALEEQANEFELFKNYVDNVHFTHPRFKTLGRPNIHAPTELTEHLTIWSLNRAVRLIMADTAVFDLYKETVTALLRCNPSPAVIAQSPALQWHLQHKSSYFEYDSSGHQIKNPTLNSVSGVLTQIFEPLGVNTSDWSMDFGNGGRFAFRERFGMPSNIGEKMRAVWLRTIPGGDDLARVDCADLYAQGLPKIDQALASGVQLQMPISRAIPAPHGRDVLQRCISCHVDTVSPVIPRFPFDQPQVMAPLLASPYKTRETLMEEIIYRTSDMATREDQMPPSRRLSREERDALINYLKEMN